MSLVAFKARNHPQQDLVDIVDDRGTPRDFFDPLHVQHQFTVDAAASDANTLLPRYFTREQDGLSQSWAAERVWCNPPFSRGVDGRGLESWVEKAWEEMVDGGCALVVMLLPANRCEQRWWQVHVEPYREGAHIWGVTLRTRFLPGRMRFAMPENYEWGPSRRRGDRPPFGCVLLTWSGA